MKNNSKNDENLSVSTELLNNETLKTWEAPQLRVLPVPSKTQGGSFTGPLADDAWYAGPNPGS